VQNDIYIYIYIYIYNMLYIVLQDIAMQWIQHAHHAVYFIAGSSYTVDSACSSIHILYCRTQLYSEFSILIKLYIILQDPTMQWIRHAHHAVYYIPRSSYTVDSACSSYCISYCRTHIYSEFSMLIKLYIILLDPTMQWIQHAHQVVHCAGFGRKNSPIWEWRN
jgi:hypothetical protein